MVGPAEKVCQVLLFYNVLCRRRVAMSIHMTSSLCTLRSSVVHIRACRNCSLCIYISHFTQGIVPLPHYVWWTVKTLLSRHIHVPTQFGATILQHYIPHVHVMRCVAYKSTCDIHSHAKVPVSHGLALHTALSLPTSAHSLKGLAIDTLHIYTQELCQFLL